MLSTPQPLEVPSVPGTREAGNSGCVRVSQRAFQSRLAALTGMQGDTVPDLLGEAF